MRQIVAELFDHMPAEPDLCAFMQYSIIFLSLPEVASDGITGIFVSQIVNAKKIVSFGLHNSWDINSKPSEMAFLTSVLL